MARLHLFDMDGTLLHNSSASRELARHLGLVAEFRQLDEDFLAGLVDSAGYAQRAFALWRGLTVQQVAAAFDSAPWLDGIREVWAEIRGRGEFCAVISLSPDFFVRRLAAWGAHEAYGTRFPELPFDTGTFDASGALTAESKVVIADRLCAAYGVSRDDCVAYGDSLSDVALFGTVPVSVAVNGDHNVSSLASFSYTGRDLRDAYALVCRT